MMRSPAAARKDRIADVPFRRAKYGRELLIDAAMLSALPAFRPTPSPHRLDFYDILLVTAGRGTFWLDGTAHAVAPGTVFFTRPGQIRRWRVRGLDGACVFFRPEFVQEAFRDARFLEAFAYFSPRAAHGALALGPAERREFLRCFRTMTREIREFPADAPHVLRAALYELLVRLNRWYAARHGGSARGSGGLVDRFVALVERDFAGSHRLGDYAAALGVTPGHLNVRCRESLGAPAGALVRRRLALEARRLLLYTDKPAFAIARELGFPDPAYFGRFFRREVGMSPRRFRVAHR